MQERITQITKSAMEAEELRRELQLLHQDKAELSQKVRKFYSH